MVNLGFVCGVLVAKRSCARASVCTHSRASTCARTAHIHALACVVQLITFDPCGAPAPALSTWRTHAQGRQWCAAASAAVDTAGLSSSQSFSHGEAVSDSFSASVGDAHLDRRVSQGQLRVEALRFTSPCSPVSTEEIITPVEDSLPCFFVFVFLTEWRAQSAF